MMNSQLSSPRQRCLAKTARWVEAGNAFWRAESRPLTGASPGACLRAWSGSELRARIDAARYHFDATSTAHSGMGAHERMANGLTRLPQTQVLS